LILLLLGMNAATVGIIALAAVQLAEKAITDKTTRILVILGACAGLCYNALWYFPTLIAIGGLVAIVWDSWLQQGVMKIQEKLRKKRSHSAALVEESNPLSEAPSLAVNEEPSDTRRESTGTVTHVLATSFDTRSKENASIRMRRQPISTENVNEASPIQADIVTHAIPLKIGVSIALTFFSTSVVGEQLYKIKLKLTTNSNFYQYSCGSRSLIFPTTPARSICQHVSRRHDYIWWRPGGNSSAP
jgi:hypothetical protein